MKNSVEEKPIEKIQAAAETAAQAETAAPRERRYRNWIFRSGLLILVASFAALSFLVSTSAYFPIDLSLTTNLQLLNPPFFNQLITLVSWSGFAPKSIIITVLVGGMLYLFGLHWEAIVAVGGAIFVVGVNSLVKLFIHRPRPAPDLVHVVAPENVPPGPFRL